MPRRVSFCSDCLKSNKITSYTNHRFILVEKPTIILQEGFWYTIYNHANIK